MWRRVDRMHFRANYLTVGLHFQHELNGIYHLALNPNVARIIEEIGPPHYITIHDPAGIICGGHLKIKSQFRSGSTMNSPLNVHKHILPQKSQTKKTSFIMDAQTSNNFPILMISIKKNHFLRDWVPQASPTSQEIAQGRHASSVAEAAGGASPKPRHWASWRPELVHKWENMGVS